MAHSTTISIDLCICRSVFGDLCFSRFPKRENTEDTLHNYYYGMLSEVDRTWHLKCIKLYVYK